MAESLELEQLNEKTLNDMRSGSSVKQKSTKENVDYLFGYWRRRTTFIRHIL